MYQRHLNFTIYHNLGSASFGCIQIVHYFRLRFSEEMDMIQIYRSNISVYWRPSRTTLFFGSLENLSDIIGYH
jgi:hypothetical protein